MFGGTYDMDEVVVYGTRTYNYNSLGFLETGNNPMIGQGTNTNNQTNNCPGCLLTSQFANGDLAGNYQDNQLIGLAYAFGGLTYRHNCH